MADVEGVAAAVRAELGEGAADEPDPEELRRFLVACGGVGPKAAQVYAKSRRWREAERVDGILEEEGAAEREGRVRRYQQYVDGLLDLEGRPVAVWRAGRVPVRAMMEDVGAAAVLRNHVYLKERSLRRAREAGHATHTVVLDMAQLGMAQMDREGLATLRAGIEVEQRHYPETFERIVIVRAPWLWSAVWSTVNPWLSENDRAKISICSEEDASATLSAFLSPEQTPDFLGGSFRTPLDGGGGGGADVPPAAAGAVSITAPLPWNGTHDGPPIRARLSETRRTALFERLRSFAVARGPTGGASAQRSTSFWSASKAFTRPPSAGAGQGRGAPPE